VEEIMIPEPVLTLPNIIITVVGVLAPFLVQLITCLVKNEALRFILATFLSGVTGLAALLIMGMPVSLVSLGAFITLSSASYKLFWKPVWKKNGSIMNAPATTYTATSAPK
jgi:hypothetical protein